ncbi:MAG: hypothetical protein N3A64_03185 [Desulfobacterota bacterium]|nr:hypothetical protein [Thermodesulfobacteriota bacterium]
MKKKKHLLAKNNPSGVFYFGNLANLYHKKENNNLLNYAFW